MQTDRTFAKIVKICAVTSCMLCILFTVAHHFFPKELLLSLAITFGTTGYHFVMRLVVGWIIPSLTRGRLNPDSFWFRQRSFEPKLYRKLHIRRWKGKMPTYNPSEFSFEENTPEQIIQNSCVAELVHQVISAASFLPLLTVGVFGALPVFLITSLLAAVFDCFFIILQRYNRPRLQRFQKNTKRRDRS